MIKTQVDLRNHNIIGRERAALIASTASRFQSTLTLERDGIVLNLKSMIGLLSQTIPKDGQIWVVADGVDEKDATEAVMKVLQLRQVENSWEGCGRFSFFLAQSQFAFPYRVFHTLWKAWKNAF